jgi:hypothetical protein
MEKNTSCYSYSSIKMLGDTGCHIVNNILNILSSPLLTENLSIKIYKATTSAVVLCTRVYPKVSGLAAWNENYKWYSPLPLGAVVSLLCESV